jgi:hypothetical protein
MTRMAEERDSILRIRAKVDSYDEWQESVTDTSPASSSQGDRIILCAPQKKFRVHRYPHLLRREGVNVEKFSHWLSTFLRDYRAVTINRQQLDRCIVCVFVCIPLRWLLS